MVGFRVDPSLEEKRKRIEHFDNLADERAQWRNLNAYYYQENENFIRQQVRAGSSVLEIGCGTGDLLAKIDPKRGLGIDISPAMVGRARQRHGDGKSAHLEFQVADAENLALAETFDYVLMTDVVGELTDVLSAFQQLHQVTRDESRVVITYFNHLWGPLLKLGEWLGLKRPQLAQNWLALKDIENLLYLADFQIVRQGYRLLLPKKVRWLSVFFNRYAAKLPFLRRLCLVTYIIARPLPRASKETSVTVLVPCRNEKGNIRGIVERTPEMGAHTEILFVDGNSNDGTIEEIAAVIAANPQRDIKLLHQVPRDSEDGQGHGKMLKLGKGDAVRKGFTAANGEVLMILDADLTVPPEDLPKFYEALVRGKGEFINGSRLVYPMEREAMQSLNKLANKGFGLLLSWIMEQAVRDTLCGTKVLYRKDYLKIEQDRAYFGTLDPFGDFDLLFGAAKQNLKIIDMPIRYRQRTYGDIKIRRFRHGLLLLKMSWIGAQKLKWR